MNFECSEAERELLASLLETAHAEKLHELHHTDTAGYKSILRQRIVTIEALLARLEVRKETAA